MKILGNFTKDTIRYLQSINNEIADHKNVIFTAKRKIGLFLIIVTSLEAHFSDYKIVQAYVMNVQTGKVEEWFTLEVDKRLNQQPLAQFAEKELNKRAVEFEKKFVY